MNAICHRGLTELLLCEQWCGGFKLLHYARSHSLEKRDNTLVFLLFPATLWPSIPPGSLIWLLDQAGPQRFDKSRVSVCKERPGCQLRWCSCCYSVCKICSRKGSGSKWSNWEQMHCSFHFVMTVVNALWARPEGVQGAEELWGQRSATFCWFYQNNRCRVS